MLRDHVRWLARAITLAAVSACAHHPGPASSENAPNSAVTGSLTYHERVALPPDAVVDVSVVDATGMDATAQDSAGSVLATAVVRAEGRQLPLPFAVHYDASKVDKQHLYTIRAAITSGGQKIFATDVMRAVITQGNPREVDLVLSRVNPSSAAATGDLAGTSWELAELGGESVVSGTHITLDFAEKGRATGNGSCNRYFSTVEISGSSIRFGAVGATRMACATAVSLQEVKYFEALEAAHRFTIEDNTLSIYGGGPRPLRFTRATR